MSVSNCTRLAWKYSLHWNRKLLSLSGSVSLKVSGMWALVPLELVLGLGVWLELRVLASWLSTSASCSLVLLLQQCFDCEQVEDVGVLVILLLVLGLAEASSQLGSLSTETMLGLGTGKNVWPGWICYNSMLKVLSKELTLVLSDTRELDRVPNTK